MLRPQGNIRQYPTILPGHSYFLNYCRDHDVLFRRNKTAHNCKTTNDYSTVFVMRLITLSTTNSAGFPLDAFTANNNGKKVCTHVKELMFTQQCYLCDSSFCPLHPGTWSSSRRIQKQTILKNKSAHIFERSNAYSIVCYVTHYSAHYNCYWSPYRRTQNKQ